MYPALATSLKVTALSSSCLQPGCVLLPTREMFFLGLQSFAVPFLWVVSTQMDRTFPEVFIGIQVGKGERKEFEGGGGVCSMLLRIREFTSQLLRFQP